MRRRMIDGAEVFATVVFWIAVAVVAGMALKAGWELMEWIAG